MTHHHVDVIDNFLNDDLFKKINETLYSDIFPWYYSKYKVYEKNNCIIHDAQLTHMFYYDHTIKSSFFQILLPILQKIDCKSIVKIKSNLTFATEKNIEHELHTDVNFPCKTGVYYVNSNDGYTLIGNNKIESVKNRMVIFNSELPHAGTSCTNEKTRCVINFNYFG